ncbi:MAG: porin family protein [Acidobacteriia bacterium]|nr:porin family protein [Terriglobia bacterium]
MAARMPSALAVLAVALAGKNLWAQNNETHQRFTASAGGGFTSVTGEQSGKRDRGYHVEAGGGYFFSANLGVTGNFLFSSLGLSSAELSRSNQINGSASVIGVTVDPTFRFRIGRGLSAYVLAGGGYVRRSVELTHNSIAQTVNIGGTQVTLDPGFVFFGPSQVTGTPISVRTTEGGGGFDAGAGVNVLLPRTRLRLFVEARYMRGFTGTSTTTIVPVTLGIRW